MKFYGRATINEARSNNCSEGRFEMDGKNQKGAKLHFSVDTLAGGGVFTVTQKLIIHRRKK